MREEQGMPSQPTPDLSPQVSDEVRKTTLHMSLAVRDKSRPYEGRQGGL